MGLLQPHGRHRRRVGQADLTLTRRPIFTAFAKAQAFGLAVGFALALLATDRMGYNIRPFLIATAGAWLAWEFFLGPRAPSHRSDAPALAYGVATGFAFPWIGLALTALLAALAP